MRNFKVTMAYDGTAYHGFQRQSNAASVQQTVEEALCTLLKEENVTINGCSRTDKGVHAREFVFNFHTDSTITEKGVVFGLNALLPGDIGVSKCEIAPDSFHARFDCKGKEYEYLVHNSRIKNPFYAHTAHMHYVTLDENKMHTAAQAFVGEHDFKAFCSTACDKKSTIRVVNEFSVKRQDDMVIFKVSANGFLYNMVRIMVGTLIFISDGRIAADSLPCIIDSKDRTKAGKTAPAQGLYLNKVFY